MLGLLKELPELLPIGSEIIDQEGVDSGEVCGVVPVEGGSWSRRSAYVPRSKLLKTARRLTRSSAQSDGQERASVEFDRAR